MNFNNHSYLEGRHAFLSPSNYHWINYDDEKLVDTYYRNLAAQRGTELHEYAATAIRLKQKQAKSRKSLNMFINDAIGFQMVPELILFYSENCFGTADAICYRRNFLRIHDYKSGLIPGNMKQLLVYTALFCLEYKIKPSELEGELRIYQSDEIICHTPTTDELVPIIDRIVTYDKIISHLKEQEA